MSSKHYCDVTMSTKDVPRQIGDLPPIGRPANSALLLQGITTLDQVAEYGPKNLLDLHGVGPKAVRILEEALTERQR
jgi:predicted flap endonuclease-1-like 5' DNA nuclease